ncbi:unnamed protein product [Merluccius merluccius]
MFNCCSHGTFLHFGLQSSRLNICYYHQDLHRGGSTWARALGFRAHRGGPRTHRGVAHVARVDRKGIPESGEAEIGLCGNANDPGEAGGSPGKSSLLFVKGRAPWNGFAPEPVYGEPVHSLLSPIVSKFGCSSTRAPLGAIARECRMNGSRWS